MIGDDMSNCLTVEYDWFVRSLGCHRNVSFSETKTVGSVDGLECMIVWVEMWEMGDGVCKARELLDLCPV